MQREFNDKASIRIHSQVWTLFWGGWFCNYPIPLHFIDCFQTVPRVTKSRYKKSPIYIECCLEFWFDSCMFLSWRFKICKCKRCTDESLKTSLVFLLFPIFYFLQILYSIWMYIKQVSYDFFYSSLDVGRVYVPYRFGFPGLVSCKIFLNVMLFSKIWILLWRAKTLKLFTDMFPLFFCLEGLCFKLFFWPTRKHLQCINGTLECSRATT